MPMRVVMCDHAKRAWRTWWRSTQRSTRSCWQVIIRLMDRSRRISRGLCTTMRCSAENQGCRVDKCYAGFWRRTDVTTGRCVLVRWHWNERNGRSCHNSPWVINWFWLSESGIFFCSIVASTPSLFGRTLGESLEVVLPLSMNRFQLLDECPTMRFFVLQVQYCQGMNYICALFLLYMPEENAFWLMVATMQRPRSPMRQLFLPGMMKVRI